MRKSIDSSSRKLRPPNQPPSKPSTKRIPRRIESPPHHPSTPLIRVLLLTSLLGCAALFSRSAAPARLRNALRPYRPSPAVLAAAMTPRGVKRIVIAREQSEGQGARVRRSIGNGISIDPFLMLDEFKVAKPAGFPDHPHRGMQTVTYMLKGTFRHQDNKGHAGTIGPGDLQWMNAARGIVHSEMPGPDPENIGLQLWVNLAAKDKMGKPAYQELLAEDVPTATSPDGKTTVKVIAGKCFDVESSVFTVTPTMYLDVKMEPNANVVNLGVPEEYNGFIYCLEGSLKVADHGEKGRHGSCIELSDGDSVSAVAGSEGARFVLIAGKPIGEPVVQHGPFVMNTQEEIVQAFRDYSAGKF